MLMHAGRAEVVGAAAHRNHQLVIGKTPTRYQFAAIGCIDGGQQNLACLTVQAAHLAGLVGKVGIGGLGKISGLLLGQITGAGGNRVQHGLPDMGGVAVHQRHRVDAFALELAQGRGHFQPRHATAHDHDAGPMSIAWRLWLSSLRLPGFDDGLLALLCLIDCVFHERP